VNAASLVAGAATGGLLLLASAAPAAAHGMLTGTADVADHFEAAVTLAGLAVLTYATVLSALRRRHRRRARQRRGA